MNDLGLVIDLLLSLETKRESEGLTLTNRVWPLIKLLISPDS